MVSMSMSKTLVSFETAKLAKEKGFDWKCYWYCTYKRKVPTNNQSFYPDLGEYKNFNENKKGFYEYFSLPTQSLLQKWLREKHKIHIEVLITEEPPYNEFYTRLFIIGKYFMLSHNDLYYKTYEEALEIGLIEGLKQIKTTEDEKI